MANEPVVIDGSRGEGGGQILRTSLALSLLTGRPVRFVNIRANRPKPGLAAQHLASVMAAAEVGSARVEGAKLGSRTLDFNPNRVEAGEYRFAIETAGSASLVLQTVALPLTLGPVGRSRIRITGGTHVRMAPPFEFLLETWAGWYQRLGLPVAVDLERHGFFPKGRGCLKGTVDPAGPLARFDDRADPFDQPASPADVPNDGVSNVSDAAKPLGEDAANAPASVVEPEVVARVSKSLDPSIGKRLAWRAAELVECEQPRVEAVRESKDPGCYVLVVDRSHPVPAVFCGLGERGKPAETVAREAAEAFLAHRRTDAAVDPHSADQIVLPLALARGRSSFRTSEITEHLRTNLQTIALFLGNAFEIDGRLGEPGRINLTGVDWAGTASSSR
jgi:RNA 3'-terminal phosphate cyclase (ATP)